MKLNFHHSITVLFALVSALGAASAQEPKHERVPSYDMPNEALMRAHDAEIQARSHQCNLLIKLAIEAVKKDDLTNAASLLKQAITAYPDGGEARIRLAHIHIRLKQPDAVIEDLKPIVIPRPRFGSSDGDEPTTRMMYVLALLDRHRWSEAVACYEKRTSMTYPGLIWHIPGGGPDHTFPDVHFSPDVTDFSGLRAQAHLILGAYTPSYIEMEDKPQYMLDHLREVLRIYPGSLDATYASAFLLAEMNRFAESQAAFARAAQIAPQAAQAEIKEAVKRLKIKEDTRNAYMAQQAAKQAKPISP